MEKDKRIEEDLQKILKKGDLYDNIALKKRVQPKNHYFKRINILLLSRILYGGILACDLIKSKLAPIDEIKTATDEIREFLGFNVDVIRSKNIHAQTPKELVKKKHRLYLLYVEENEPLDIFRNNLKKLLDFTENYDINQIAIKAKEVDRFPIYRNYAYTTNLRFLLEMELQRKDKAEANELRELYYVYDKDSLKSIIAELDELDIDLDLDFIKKLLSHIDDPAITMAIKNFYKNHNVKILEDLILARLISHLNDENTSKNKLYGKVFENIDISSEFIKVTATTSDGEIIKNEVSYLYDYLEVKDYEDLLHKLELNPENCETLAIAALYLYLCTNRKEKTEDRTSSLSFYDKIYERYKAKSKGKIQGLYNKKDKLVINIVKSAASCIMTFILILLIALAGFSYDTINYYLGDNPTDTLNSIMETIYSPYKYSFELERDLLNLPIEKAQEQISEFLDKIDLLNIDLPIPSYIGKYSDILSDDFIGGTKEQEEKGQEGSNSTPNESDEKTNNSVDQSIESLFNEKTESDKLVEELKTSDDKSKDILAKVNILNDYMFAPTYYGTKYATSASYQDGNIVYDLKTAYIDPSEFCYIKPLFSVSINITPDIIKDMLKDDGLNIIETLYPLGYNFVITQVEIKDLANSNNSVTINPVSTTFYGEITDFESLLNMKNPEITYYYGVQSKENTFVSAMKKEGPYTNLDEKQARKIITDSLGIPEYSTLEEIYWAIKNKNYSTTPFKDAKISTSERSELTEQEYLKTIASLDNLNNDLAITLMVNTFDNLIYTTGFTCNENCEITTKDSTSWITTKDGNIINPIPVNLAKDIEQEVVDNILKYSILNKIPIGVAIILISLIFKKLFGKKLNIKIRINRIKSLANTEGIENSYCNIKKSYYGGLNLPKKEQPEQFIKTIHNEFSGLTKEELTALLKELKQTKDYRATRLAKEIPFIIENQDILTRALKKQNQDKRYRKER